MHFHAHHLADVTQCRKMRMENGTSLSFCSQKEKRDENAMLATLLSWAGPVRVWWGREGGMKRWVTDEGTSRQEAGTMDAGLHSYVMWGHKLQVNKTHNAGKKRRFLALLGRKKLLNSGICSKLHIKGIYFIKTLKRIQKSSQFWTCWHSILQQETYDRRMEGQLCSLYSCSLISI